MFSTVAFFTSLRTSAPIEDSPSVVSVPPEFIVTVPFISLFTNVTLDSADTFPFSTLEPNIPSLVLLSYTSAGPPSTTELACTSPDTTLLFPSLTSPSEVTLPDFTVELIRLIVCSASMPLSSDKFSPKTIPDTVVLPPCTLPFMKWRFFPTSSAESDN